jgi:hypothetical protein
MNEQLQRAINLVRKTGDRILIFDRNSGNDNVFAIMSLDEYEKLALNRNEVINLTEEELLDKINRDIAVWKSQQDIYPGQREEADEFDFFDSRSEIEDGRSENSNPASGKLKREKRRWSIPEERKEAAEEIIEEDRQYLEEITF